MKQERKTFRTPLLSLFKGNHYETLESKTNSQRCLFDYEGVGTMPYPSHTLTPGDGLRERLEYLLHHAEEERTVRVLQQKQQMAEIEQFHTLFTKQAQVWFLNLILPRLSILTEMFPNASEPFHIPLAQSAGVTFEKEHGYIAHAKFSVRFQEKFETNAVIVICETEMFPMLVEYERTTDAEFPCTEESAENLATFLDEHIVRFADLYLTIHQTTSPYMKDKRTTDPVCGMDIFIADAAATTMYKKTRYYFCSSECLQAFEHDSERYYQQ